MQMQGSDLIGLVSVVLGCMMFLIPIAGFTLRYSIKPIVEALKLAREGNTERETIMLLERRMALLEQEVNGVGELRAELNRLLEAKDFEKQLSQPRG